MAAASIATSSLQVSCSTIAAESKLLPRRGFCLFAPGKSISLPPTLATSSLARKNFWVKNSATAAEISSSKQQNVPSFGPDDFVFDLAEKLEELDYVSALSATGKEALSHLREHSAETTLSLQWPTNKVEAYRFTDLRFLRNSNVEPVRQCPQDTGIELADFGIRSNADIHLVFADGVISSSSSNWKDGVFVGSIAALSDDHIEEFVIKKLGKSAEWINTDFFASLNGIGVRELGVVIVPEGVKMQSPLHIIYHSSEGGSKDGEKQSYALSCPRLLVLVGKEAEVTIIEEFVGEKGEFYWSNAVGEFFIEEHGRICHNYVQNQAREAVHIKQTCVAQKQCSSYELVEAAIGSKLNRHNIHIQQLGPDTSTKMSSFLLAGQRQLQDLHSRLILSHPRGFARQLHKCIVMHSSGHGVFDGNVKVNRYAQQTDAGQLSRSLLLAPRATVSVKPNLQIIADDVKCSHGAAISDLEEEQIFYFQARGIDPQTARSTLVFSFGAEILQQFKNKNLQQRAEKTVMEFLQSEGAIKTSIQEA
ncbi:hypothetical protein KP509_04G082400 [Ceratopteris richardii]|uniref:Uncharacterized protein n=1 Tax=Ceratopteris richardii TaxID=49495 RepID=A0A8T2V153_CERRI|nr:hypothetical protein KP509_04G082400 [Ceratopteris richardii]